MRERVTPELSGDDFLRWEAQQPGKHELHHGFVFALAGGTTDHGTLASNMLALLRSAFPSPCRTFGSDVKVRLAADIFYYPDVSVVCRPIPAVMTFLESPCVVVEVLSPSTRTYDLVDKRAAYRALDALDAYVIVHSDLRRVEVDGRDGGSWRTVTYDDDGDALVAGRLIRLADIYADTSLV